MPTQWVETIAEGNLFIYLFVCFSVCLIWSLDTLAHLAMHTQGVKTIAEDVLSMVYAPATSQDVAPGTFGRNNKHSPLHQITEFQTFFYGLLSLIST